MLATLLVPNAYHVGRYPRLAFGRRLRGKSLLGLRERAKCVSQFHVSNQIEKLRVHIFLHGMILPDISKLKISPSPAADLEASS